MEGIKTKQLRCYGHAQRMSENRVPKQILRWTPQWKRVRPQTSWMDGTKEKKLPRDLRYETYRIESINPTLFRTMV